MVISLPVVKSDQKSIVRLAKPHGSPPQVANLLMQHLTDGATGKCYPLNTIYR